jgi:enoyl-CoA hydratase/carnithine racemase
MVRVEREGSVVRITLDRPEVLNAFNDELIRLLTEAFGSLERDVRVVVLAGKGSAFCAGGDLEWMRSAAARSEEENYQDALRLANLYEAIATCRAGVIAKVHGSVFGGGCGLVAAADIAVAASQTKFAFSEVRLGLIPATVSAVVVPKIGRGHARALFTTGEVFGAEIARRIGLVHIVAEPDELEAHVHHLTRDILQSGPEAVAAAKSLTYGAPIGKEDTARLLAKVRSTDEAKEGIAAFLEKRKPSFWSDR